MSMRMDEAEGLEFLARAGHVLNTSLDMETTLANVAGLAVPALADWCVVDLLEEDGTIRQLGVAHVDPAKAELARNLRLRYPPGRDHPLWRVLGTGEPELDPEIHDEDLAARARDAAHLLMLREIGIRSHIVVPLVARGRVLGALSFVCGHSGRKYDEDDLSLAKDLAARCALAVDNARLYAEAREAILRKDETLAMLDTLLQNAPIGFAFLDLEHRHVRVNDAMARMIGLPPAEILGRSVREVAGEWADTAEELLESVARSGRPLLDVERSGPRLDSPGEQGDWVGNYYPVRGPNGDVLGVGVLVADVTERRSAERLQAAEFAVIRLLAEAETLDAVAPAVLEAVRDALGWDFAAIWRLDPDGNSLRCVDVRTSPSLEAPEFVRLTRVRPYSRDEGLPGRVWASGDAEWVPDLTSEHTFPRAEAGTREGIHSGLGFPIGAGSHFLGVIEFYSRERRRPDDEQLRTMTRIGSHMAQFAERTRAEAHAREGEARIAKLYEAEQEARRLAEGAAGRTALLQTVTAALSVAVSVAEVVKRVVDVCVPLLGAYAGAAYLLTEDGSRAELVHSSGYPDDVVSRWRHVDTSAPTPMGDCMRSGEPVMIEDRKALSARYPGMAGQASSDSEGWLAVPLLLKGRALGAMTFSFRDARRFGADDAAFLAALGRQAAQAVERARLYEAERNSRAAAEAAQHRLAFLAKASAVLGESLDYDQTLARVARIAVPDIADWCSIDIVDEDLSIRQLAVAHIDPAKVELAREFRRRYPVRRGAPYGVAHVVETGQPELYDELTEDILRASPNPEARELVKTLQLGSVMIVPLAGRQRVLGAITLVSAESGRRFGPDDLALAQELAARGAQAIENARLYRERDYIARTLQQSLLPARPPEIPGLELAGRYLPAGAGTEVGGDFYDVFETVGAWTLVMGDVCGKGAEAAAVTGLARHTIRAAAIREPQPSRVLHLLNEALLAQRADQRFCTVCLVRVIPAAGAARLTVCSAGHPLPLVLRADGSLESAGRPGTLLGVFHEAELVDQEVDLRAGDALVLFTDGVTEERDAGRLFGDEELGKLLLACRGFDAGAIAESIERAVVEFQPGPPRDDIALLVLRVPPL